MISNVIRRNIALKEEMWDEFIQKSIKQQQPVGLDGAI